MQRRPFPFDPLLAERVLSYIRSGGYPLVAAEAAGVPAQVFLQWVDWGEKKKAREPYRGFARGVRQAAAQGRLVAELAVHEKDPKFWLTHGPGKERPRHPGWTGEVRGGSGTDDSTAPAGNGEAPGQTLHTLVMRTLEALP